MSTRCTLCEGGLCVSFCREEDEDCQPVRCSSFTKDLSVSGLVSLVANEEISLHGVFKGCIYTIDSGLVVCKP